LTGRRIRNLSLDNTVNADLLRTLKALPTDPARVVDLYPQLYASYFLVPAKVRSEADFETALFMIYPCADGSLEVPVFTSTDYVFELPTEAVLLTARGDTLWPRLLDLLRSEECEVAVDPGQSHGIRLHKEMILGMIRAYGL
jgi:hypothetical protein